MAHLLTVSSVVALCLGTLAACGADEGRVADTGGEVGLDAVASDAPPSADVDPDSEVPSAEVVSPVLAEHPSTRGTEFWVAFMENLTLSSNGPPTFAFFISASPNATGPTLGRVEIPQTGYSQVFQVPSGEVLKVTMPSGTLYPQLNEMPSKFGVHITAEAPVEVVAVHYRIYFSEASRILPAPELGDHYVVVTGADLQGLNPSELVIAATEDATTIAITPSVTTTGFLPPGLPQQFTLARGETIQFQAGGDLSGTDIRALGGQRIAVFAGARQAYIACIGADSHLWDQMLPVARWGNRYLVMPLAESGATPIKIVADRFKTPVQISCQDTVVVNPGEGKTIAIAQPTLLSANQPIGVAAFVKSEACMAGGTGDPNFLVVPPLGLTTDALDWNAIGDYETFAQAHHWVSVVIRSADLAKLTLDGAALSGNSGFAAVVGAPDLMAGQLSVSAGPHHLAAAGARFQAWVYGLASYDAYTFGGGYDCSDCAPLSAAAPPTGCPAGDLDVARPGTGTDPGKDPGAKNCVTACDCYERGGDPVTPCSEGEAIWACRTTCEPTCGDPCDACPSRFASGPDGRCQ